MVRTRLTEEEYNSYIWAKGLRVKSSLYWLHFKGNGPLYWFHLNYHYAVTPHPYTHTHTHTPRTPPPPGVRRFSSIKPGTRMPTNVVSVKSQRSTYLVIYICWTITGADCVCLVKCCVTDDRVSKWANSHWVYGNILVVGHRTFPGVVRWTTRSACQ